MKHLITGGSGFFGLHLIDRLLKEKQEIVVYDVLPLDEDIIKTGHVQYIQGDVRDESRLKEAMKGVDIVHHNAAVLPVSRSGKVFWEVNVNGTKNVLVASNNAGVRKVLFISTSSVYGIPSSLPINEQTSLTPLGDYGWSKYEAEQVVKDIRSSHTLDVSIVRPRTIVGTGRMGIFGILFDWIAAGKRIYILGDGTNLFQLLSAPDLACACVLMTTTPCINEDFVIGAEEYSTVREDMESLIAHAHTSSRVQPVNAFMARTLLSIVDWMKISPLVDWHYKTPHKPFYFDISKAKTVLGWQPQDSNASMLCNTFDWYIKNRNTLRMTTGTTHRKGVKQGILNILRWLS